MSYKSISSNKISADVIIQKIKRLNSIRVSVSQRKNSLRNTINKINSDPNKRKLDCMKTFSSTTLKRLIEQQKDNEQGILE